MQKKDLKTGMLVQTRNGVVWMIINNCYYTISSHNGLEYYTNDLRNISYRDRDRDLVKVSKVLKNHNLRPEHWTEETLNENLAWERQEFTEYVEILVDTLYFNKGGVYEVKFMTDNRQDYALSTHSKDDYWFSKVINTKPSTKEAYEAQFKAKELTVKEIQELLGYEIKIVK